jgi:hypothetical protein
MRASVAVRHLRLVVRVDLAGQLALQLPVQRVLLVAELAPRDGDVQLAPAGGALAHQVHRHRVQHLVAEHHAVPRVREAVQPHHLRETAQQLLLAGAQFARQFHDGVLLQRDAGGRQFGQDVEGQLAGAGAELEDARRALSDNSGCHVGQRGAEQRRQLGGGCKIAILAQLGGAAAVIAEIGGVQRQLHVAGEGNGARRALDFGGDQVLQGVGRGQRVARRCG